MKKTILHLCADTGSDSWPYQHDDSYDVIKVGQDIGVENYSPDRPIHGVIANPVCREFSQVRRGKPGDNYSRASRPEDGLGMVDECIRVIREADPVWWAIENPATGTLKKYLGKPDFVYQPWWYGSPWTKSTGLWGNFTPPPRKYWDWEEVEKIEMWKRPGRDKPTFAYLHKSAFNKIPEFYESGMPFPKNDSEFRSLCSQKFAQAFKEANP